MATEELDRYMNSLERYLRKVDALDETPRRTLCKNLLPNFGHIGILFLSNHDTCPQALRGLQIVVKLIYHSRDSCICSDSNSEKTESTYPILSEFIDQLQTKIITGKLAADGNFESHKLTFLLPQYRKSLVLLLVKDCLNNIETIDSCITKNPLTEFCCQFYSLFFSVILTFCDILKVTDGHWFMGRIIALFKRSVISQVNGSTNQLYPPHIRPFLPHLELLDIQLTGKFIISSKSEPHQVAEKLCSKLNYSLLPGICKWDEIVALLILYPTAADFLISQKLEWINKFCNSSRSGLDSNGIYINTI